MKIRTRFFLRIASLCIGLVALSATSMGEAGNSFDAAKNRRNTRSQLEAPSQTRVSESYAKLPLYFETNQGQTDPRVKFLSHGAGHTLFLTPSEAVLILTKTGQQDKTKGDFRGRRLQIPEYSTQDVLRVTFRGANSQPLMLGQEELPGNISYFIGNDPTKWQTNVRSYGRIYYRDLYPGIDLTYYGNQRQLEYDFLVKPGADPKQITFDVRGARKLEVDDRGDLIVHTALGLVRQRKPTIYQPVHGMRREVSGGYILRGKHRVGFELGAYDRTQILIIDPVLLYFTYLGGNSADLGFGIALDASSNAYVTGKTASTNFPKTAGAFPNGGGSQDAFVTKLDSTGALIYSTFLGGNSLDQGNGIAVDSLGNAYVTGETASTNFPVTTGAFQTTYHPGSSDAFVTKLNPTGTALVYSTYLGGTDLDEGMGIAVDPLGNAFISGETKSTNFPFTAGAFRVSFGGNLDGFVTKLNPLGTGLIYSTYLGGNNFDEALSIAVDSGGNAYVTGDTNSTNFPTTVGAFQTFFAGGGVDAFVTKLDPLGTAAVYSTYLGSNGFDQGNGIAVDSSGNAYVAGITDSFNFPMTPGAFQTLLGGDADGFVTKLNSSGTALVYSTYLGGSGADQCNGIALDSSGNAYVAGDTNSSNFPTTLGSFPYAGGGDGFVTQLNSSGTDAVYSTYIGGSGADAGNAIAVDSGGLAYVTGYTNSTDFQGAFQTSPSGDFDVFVTKVSRIGPPATLTLAPPSATNTAGQQHCVTATVNDAFGNPTPNVTVIFSVTGANSAGGSKTTDANGQATFCYTGTKAGVDTIKAFADTNNNGTQDSGEPSGTASKTYVAAAPATLTLTPATATNTVGQQHCVTATVKDAFGNATSNVAVIFSVTGANSAGGSKTTDANGQAAFCYTGTKAGIDTIKAFADINGNGIQDSGEPFGTASKTYVAGAPATLTLTPATATNTVGQQHCVTATVKDAFGNATSNVTVIFSVTGANSASGSKTTDANGQATFCYTGTKAGVDTIKAFADINGNGIQDSGEPSGSATKNYVPGNPATVTLSPAAATDIVGQQHCVTATLKDAFGNPTPNITAVFSVSGANSANGSSTTDSNGQSTFCYTGTVAGLDTIKCFADTNKNGKQDGGEPSGTATKTYVAGAPATLTLTPATATNTAGQQHCVTATVKDSFGNATPNITVVFSVTGANSANGSKTTDSNGQATFCYTGTKPGTDTIKAFADTNKNGTQDSGEPSATASKTYVPGAPATVTLTPTTATNTVGQQHCVTATVKDAFGNATPNITVIFSVTGTNSANGSKTTDANGQATFCYTGTKAGTDTIKAFADTNNNGTQDSGEPSGTASKIYVAAAPATLTLTPATATNTVGQQHCVTATVKDSFGNATPNITVVFSVTGANSANGSKTTDANGQAIFCYTGTKAGTDTIKAFADTNKNGTQDSGEPAGTASKTYVAAAPATLTLTPATATNTAGQQHCVTATVRDSFGNPTPNITVIFSVTGANSASGSKTTDANGQATFCYTGTKAGVDAISAFADTNGNGKQNGTEPSGTASKTYVAAAPATLTLTPATATNTTGQQHCVTATVKDAFGNPTPIITVIFSVTGANSAGGSAITNANGQATFCYTGTKAGVDTIKAFADTNKNGIQNSGEPSGTASKTYVAGAPPPTLVLAPKMATNPVGQEHCVTATVKDAFGNAMPNVVVIFSVTGANNASGSQTTNPAGQATFCYTGTQTGEDTIKAFADTNRNGAQDIGEPSDTASKIFFAFPQVGAEGGGFVIGDQNAVVGQSVTFWGAQWWNLNLLSGGAAPPAFKGFANQSDTMPPTCGGQWSSAPGLSLKPPSDIPSFIAVIVSSSIKKYGNLITGNISKIVIVKTHPGYAPNPGHAGTGEVVGVICQ